jgi:hypothetical protein
MNITQTVEIPADRRLHLDFDVPIGIPIGKAQVELKVIPFVNKPDNSGKFRLSKQELDEILRDAQTPISDSLTGILAHLGDITIEQIREERLAKYLK